MKTYVCSVCGYVHHGDNPPSECPVCHVPAERFHLVEEKVSEGDEIAKATGLKPETLAKADEIVAKYPQKRSATLPLLHLAQEELGYVTDAAMKWIAAKLGIEPINVYEVVTFYPMFRLAPIGRRHVKVCRTLSCALRGSYKTMEALEKEFGCRRGETSADGNVTLEFVECMACCGTMRNGERFRLRIWSVKKVQLERLYVLICPRLMSEGFCACWVRFSFLPYI